MLAAVLMQNERWAMDLNFCICPSDFQLFSFMCLQLIWFAPTYPLFLIAHPPPELAERNQAVDARPHHRRRSRLGDGARRDDQ